MTTLRIHWSAMLTEFFFEMRLYAQRSDAKSRGWASSDLAATLYDGELGHPSNIFG